MVHHIPGYIKYVNNFLNNYKSLSTCNNLTALAHCYANYKTLGVLYSQDIMNIILNFEEPFVLNDNCVNKQEIAKDPGLQNQSNIEYYNPRKLAFAQSRVKFQFINFVKASNNFILSDSIDKLKSSKPVDIQCEQNQTSNLSINNGGLVDVNGNIENFITFKKALQSEKYQDQVDNFVLLDKSQYFVTKTGAEVINSLHKDYLHKIDINEHVEKNQLFPPPELIDSDSDISTPQGAVFYELPILEKFYLRNSRRSVATGILQESFQSFKMPMVFSERDSQMHLMVCNTTLASIDLCENQSITKCVLSQFVMEKLQKSKWTLMKNMFYISEFNESAVNVDKSGLYQTNLKDPSKIETDTNIGGKLMLKMGWDKNSGLGKGGTGIKEPIINDMNDKRKGIGFDLGSSKDLKSFANNVTKTLVNWIKSEDDDLIFDRQFDNKERAMIHKECRKLGLVSKSYNNCNGDRFLVVSSYRDPASLFEWVQGKGGKTKLYTLMPPGLTTY